MYRLAVVALVCVLALAGCGSSKHGGGTSGSASAPSSHTHFAKTKFVLHAGLAFGAFHRYILKPFEAGKLGGGLFKNRAAKLKAALAAVFAYHELKLALRDARSSRILSKLLSPLLALQTKLSALGSELKRGHTSGVTAASSEVTSIGQQSAQLGQPIADQPTPSLGG